MENVRELIYTYLNNVLDDFKNRELSLIEDRLITEFYIKLLFLRSVFTDNHEEEDEEEGGDYMKWMSMGWFIDKVLTPSS